MIIEEKIAIHAPLSQVWQVFANLTAWEQWNSVCQDCCLLAGEEMAAGNLVFLLSCGRITCPSRLSYM